MPGSLTDEWEIRVLNFVLNPGAAAMFATVTPHVLALFTVNLTETNIGAGASSLGEVPQSPTGYERQPILPGTGATNPFAYSGGVYVNTGTVAFPNMPACTVVGFCIYGDTAGANGPIFYCNLTAPITVPAGGAVVFPPGSIQVSLD